MGHSSRGIQVVLRRSSGSFQALSLWHLQVAGQGVQGVILFPSGQIPTSFNVIAGQALKDRLPSSPGALRLATQTADSTRLRDARADSVCWHVPKISNSPEACEREYRVVRVIQLQTRA
jgi:hypothetical protein